MKDWIRFALVCATVVAWMPLVTMAGLLTSTFLFLPWFCTAGVLFVSRGYGMILFLWYTLSAILTFAAMVMSFIFMVAPYGIGQFAALLYIVALGGAILLLLLILTWGRLHRTQRWLLLLLAVVATPILFWSLQLQLGSSTHAGLWGDHVSDSNCIVATFLTYITIGVWVVFYWKRDVRR